MATFGPVLAWKGKLLAERLWVCSGVERYLFWVAPQRALLMLRSGMVRPLMVEGQTDERDKKIWRLILNHPVSSDMARTSGRLPSGRDFATPASVYRRRESKIESGLPTFSIKKRNVKDRWAYLLSITENTVKMRRRGREGGV